MTRPVLLDLFAGAGGSACGYHRAGFDIIGVDIAPQTNYPFEFHQMDWREGLERFTGQVTAIHASPPCQAYSTVSNRSRHRARREKYPDLLANEREALQSTGKPYIIENVAGAPLQNAVMLCGSSFGLDVRRHRFFECSFLVLTPSCEHGRQKPRFRSLDSRQKTLATVIGVHGHHNYPGEHELRCAAMDIFWMTPQELTQAIPPAYCEFLGKWLLRVIDGKEG